MARPTTWKPWIGEGEVSLPAYVYAFPKQRIDPLIDAVCVRTALEHFHLVPAVSDEERSAAFQNIRMAAEHFHVEVYGETYEEMLHRPQVEIISRD